MTSDGWQRWSRVRRHFHAYSLLISGQTCRDRNSYVEQLSWICLRQESVEASEQEQVAQEDTGWGA